MTLKKRSRSISVSLSISLLWGLLHQPAFSLDAGSTDALAATELTPVPDAFSATVDALPTEAVAAAEAGRSKSFKTDERAVALARKAVEALGGMDKIKKFNATAYRAKGKLEQISSLSGSSNTLSCELVSQGRSQLVSVNFMGQPVVTGYDGNQCWTKQGDSPMPTDPVTAKRVKEDLDHGLLLVEKFLDRNRRLSMGESKKINSIDCEALVVYADDGKPTTFYLDPQSKLIVRSEYQGADVEQGVDCVKAYEYLDYRKLDGTMQPFKSIEFSDKKKVGVIEINTFETGITLPSGYFRMPTETKIARLKEGPVIVPFQFTSNEILVSASVNGLPGKLFLLDTGATQSIIDTECFQNIAPKDSEEIAITTGSGAMKMKYMKLKSFRLGDVTIEDVPVAIADLSKFSQLLNVRPTGLIGANILKRFLITIDYEKHELILQDPDKVKPPANAIVVETKPTLGVSGLAVEGVIDDKLKLSFLIDSGAAFNHVSESLIKDLGSEPILPVGIIKGLDGTPVHAGAIRFKTLEIGKLKISEPVFSVAPSAATADGPQGIISGGALAIIGNPLLSRYRITIDYRNQRLFFEDTLPKAEVALETRFNDIMKDYYRRENSKDTASKLLALEGDSLTDGYPAVASLALANLARIEFQLSAADGKTANVRLDEAERKFRNAYELACKSNRKAVIAQTLSLWAQHYIESGKSAELAKARPLIAKALTTCPTEPTAYAVAGLFLTGTSATTGATKQDAGESNSTKSSDTADGTSTKSGEPTADVLLNQSLMLDPANWLALWTKYSLAERTGKTQERTLIAKHLRKYYPDAEKVKKLELE